MYCKIYNDIFTLVFDFFDFSDIIVLVAIKFVFSLQKGGVISAKK